MLTIDRPGVKGPRYVLSGQVRYGNVQGTSYLALWDHFPGGGQYSSRTLGDAGPMMKLQGTSGWRAFALPFDATGAPAPTRLGVNVVLQGRGSVYLGPLTLRDLDGAGSAGSPGSDTERIVSIAGATAGTVMGCLGALMGVLAAAASWLLLVGVIGTVLPLGLLPSIRRRYEAIELRAMQAHDA